jgi:hypothetical protein
MRSVEHHVKKQNQQSKTSTKQEKNNQTQQRSQPLNPNTDSLFINKLFHNHYAYFG